MAIHFGFVLPKIANIWYSNIAIVVAWWQQLFVLCVLSRSSLGKPWNIKTKNDPFLWPINLKLLPSYWYNLRNTEYGCIFLVPKNVNLTEVIYLLCGCLWYTPIWFTAQHINTKMAITLICANLEFSTCDNHVLMSAVRGNISFSGNLNIYQGMTSLWPVQYDLALYQELFVRQIKCFFPLKLPFSLTSWV